MFTSADDPTFTTELFGERCRGFLVIKHFGLVGVFICQVTDAPDSAATSLTKYICQQTRALKNRPVAARGEKFNDTADIDLFVSLKNELVQQNEGFLGGGTLFGNQFAFIRQLLEDGIFQVQTT